MTKKLIFLVFFCLLIQFGSGQPYYFRHYQVENGLSNNAVICSLQDSKGFMWFGTRDGLNRFDGYTFKVFNHDAQDSLSLGNNFVHSLFEDARGNIWVGTDLGIYIYNPLTEKFSHFKYDRSAAIDNMQADSSGNIWYTSFSSLIKYDVKQQQVTNFGKLGTSAIDAIAVSERGVWVGSSNGEIKLLNPALGEVKSYDVFSHSPIGEAKTITCLLWDEKSGGLWIGTSKQGMKWLAYERGIYQDLVTYSEDGQPIYVHDIKKVENGEYWAATELGVFIYSGANGQYTQLKKGESNPWSLSDNATYTISKDREGGIWVGSWFGGVSYYHKQHTFFEKFFPIQGENSLSGSAVREIMGDQEGNLWIGTENGGLNKLHLKTGLFEHFRSPQEGVGLSSINIHGLLTTGDTLWVGTFHQGLYLIQISTGKLIQRYTVGKGAYDLKSNFIYTMLRLKSGEVLLATDRGVYQYMAEKRAFKLVEGLPGNIFYTSLYEDSAGTIWAGSWRDGLYFYHPKTRKKGKYIHSDQRQASLSSNRITYIMESSDRQIWIATEEGLCKLDPIEGVFKRYQFHKTAQSLLVCTILEDDHQQLWISTSKGLIKFNPKTTTSRFFGVANGLLSDQFNYNAAYKAKDGTLYFGTVKGLIRFHPSKLQEKSDVPPIYFTGFQVYNHEVKINEKKSPLKKSITFTDTIILMHNQSTFSIDFAALSYTSPEMTEYAYKMDGLDPDWTYLQTNRKAYFTELPPGNYVFRVTTLNNLRKRVGKESLLYVQIRPPIWASWPAYLLYLIMLLYLIYYLFRSYHRRLREKNRIKLEQLAHKKEEEMYRAKIEFFTQVAHEIRTPLTLIKGPMEKIVKQVEQVPSVRKNLLIMEKNTERLLQLSSQLLDFRKAEAKGFSLSYQQVYMNRFLKEQVERLGPTANELHIKVKSNFPKEHLEVYVDKEALDKIVSNLLNNALKYAAGKIVVRLVQEISTFKIEIASDGDRIPDHLRYKIFEPFYRVPGHGGSIGTGLGLALARSLAELHGGTLLLDTGNKENFNIFVLTLPINQEKVES